MDDVQNQPKKGAPAKEQARERIDDLKMTGREKTEEAKSTFREGSPEDVKYRAEQAAGNAVSKLTGKLREGGDKIEEKSTRASEKTGSAGGQAKGLVEQLKKEAQDAKDAAGKGGSGNV